jgi:hypothetical protein
VSGLILHGGGAAKVSGAYEEEWNLFCILDVLAGLANSMLVEVPGPAGVGFEFWIRRPSAREWHQVKAQNSNRSRWTLAELRKAEVLKNFGDKLAADHDDLCVFVSPFISSLQQAVRPRLARARPGGNACDICAHSGNARGIREPA